MRHKKDLFVFGVMAAVGGILSFYNRNWIYLIAAVVGAVVSLIGYNIISLGIKMTKHEKR